MLTLWITAVCLSVATVVTAEVDPDNPCSLPIDVGPCEALIPRYTYDRTTGQCVRFDYGGCDGNANNFGSYWECLRTCWQRCEGGCARDEKCLLQDVECIQAPCPPLQTCTATKRCPKGAAAVDEYGQELMCTEDRGCPDPLTCNMDPADRFSTCCEEDPCAMKRDEGSCTGHYPRYYFDPDTSRCELFVWGGCEGNGNRFGSWVECYMSCKQSGWWRHFFKWWH